MIDAAIDRRRRSNPGEIPSDDKQINLTWRQCNGLGSAGPLYFLQWPWTLEARPSVPTSPELLARRLRGSQKKPELACRAGNARPRAAPAAPCRVGFGGGDRLSLDAQRVSGPVHSGRARCSGGSWPFLVRMMTTTTTTSMAAPTPVARSPPSTSRGARDRQRRRDGPGLR
jgi:hypothetical protein